MAVLRNPVTVTQLEDAANLIREDLHTKSLRSTISYLEEITTKLSSRVSSAYCGTLLTAHQKLALSFSSKRHDVSQTGVAIKTYHFYNFELHNEYGSLNIKKIRYCKLVIEDNRKCRLVIPANFGQFNQHVRARYALQISAIESKPAYTRYEDHARYGLPFEDKLIIELSHQAAWLQKKSIFPRGKLTADIVFELDDHSLATALKLIFTSFHPGDQLRNADEFIKLMRQRINKYTQPELCLVKPAWRHQLHMFTSPDKCENEAGMRKGPKK